jgi:hypothetical protein
MSLESRYEALKADIEAWWVKHVGHPTVGSIAAQHLNTEGKPELDKLVDKFTAPEPAVFHVEQPEVVTPAPETYLPPSVG